jgi:hypothetical protein
MLPQIRISNRNRLVPPSAERNEPNERCLSLSELGAQTRDYARCGWVLSWDSLVGQEHALFGQSECIDL